MLLNGVRVTSPLHIDAHLDLQPADTSHLDFNTAIGICSSAEDMSVVLAFIPIVSAQIRVIGKTPKEIMARAWNAQWDVLLLSAILNVEIGFNLQSDTNSSDINSSSRLQATNFHFRAFTKKMAYELTEKDIEWLQQHFSSARALAEDERFRTAVHCLASYRWHSLPRIKLAVLWAGIEGESPRLH